MSGQAKAAGHSNNLSISTYFRAIDDRVFAVPHCEIEGFEQVAPSPAVVRVGMAAAAVAAAAPKKLLTLVYVRRGTQILLGYKKRGFGAGKWNGFGGKLEEGESMEQCARRELQEEAGIEVESMSLRGIINFRYQTLPRALEVHVFEGQGIVDEAALGESEEMRPQWFEESAIPLDQMWADDPYWLPGLLRGDFGGQLFDASFVFRGHEGPSSQEILEHTVRIKE